MNTIDLEEVKNAVAKKYGYVNIQTEIIKMNEDELQNFINEVATEYARQCCDEQIKACSRIEALKNREPYSGVHAIEVLSTRNVVKQ